MLLTIAMLLELLCKVLINMHATRLDFAFAAAGRFICGIATNVGISAVCVCEKQ